MKDIPEITVYIQMGASVLPSKIKLTPRSIADDIAPTPSSTQIRPAETEYAAAKTKLQALGTSWDGYDAAGITWGVTDKASFVKAAGVALRPLLNLLGVPDLGRLGADGQYAKVIVPALKALGCKNIVSAADLSAQHDAVVQNVIAKRNYSNMPIMAYIHSDMQSDMILAAILNPLFGFVEDLTAGLADNAVGTLLELLPNLVYHFDALDALLNLELTPPGGDPIKVLAGIDLGGLDLSQGVAALLNGVIADATSDLGITLPPINWDAIAHAGDYDAATDTVKADRSLEYALLLQYLRVTWDSNQHPITENVLVDAGVPAFLSPVVFQLVKGLLWLLLL